PREMGGSTLKRGTRTMKNKLLITTAALLAGIAYASAQDTGRGQSQGGAGNAQEMQKGSKGGSASQGQRQENRQPQPQRGQTQGQRDQTSGQGQQSQAPQQGQAGQQTQASGRVELNTEQRNQIRQQILSRSDAPRADGVNISVNVGTVIPTSIRVEPVPQ